jgi:hypothetical protein
MATQPAQRVYSPWWIIRLILLILAIICFLIAAFGMNIVFGSVMVIPLGLALGFAAMLPI